MEERFSEWVDMLLAAHGLKSKDKLTPAIIANAIRDTKESLANESLWALGAPTKTIAAIHMGNAKTLRNYIRYLETLLPEFAAC